MVTVYVPYLSERFLELIADGWVHWCQYVDENGGALLVKNSE